MSTSDEFTEYILDLLSSVSEVHTSKMFGGVLLKVGSRQLGVIIEDTLYLKVTDLDLQKVHAGRGSQQFKYSRKDKKDPVVIKNWWSVPESAMDNREEFEDLVDDVLDQKE